MNNPESPSPDITPQTPDSSEQKSGIKGVEYKQLFPEMEQRKIYSELGQWFELVKNKLPRSGVVLRLNRHSTDGNPISANQMRNELSNESKIQLPDALFSLMDAILTDSAQDPQLNSERVKFIIERTGSNHTHSDDYGYHIDTKEAFWDNQGHRIGYDSRRSLPKYLTFINRPGSIIVHDQVDPSLNHAESNLLAQQYKIDSEGLTHATNIEPPTVSQLLPNATYKVAVGDLLHSPPPHKDGLFITSWFNDQEY